MRWLVIVGFAVALLGRSPEVLGENRVPEEDQPQGGITVLVGNDGKIVFTNLASFSSPAPAVASAPAFTAPATRVPASSVVRTASRSPAVLDPLIDAISSLHGVDATLVRAVMEVESNFEPRAVSPKGAMGLMQPIQTTGQRFGVRDFFDPAQNIDGGVRYLRFLLEKFEGDLNLSLAAYNSGEGRVERLGRIPDIPETQNYVRKVRSAYSRMGGAPTARIQRAVERVPQQRPLMVASGTTANPPETPPVSKNRIFSGVDDRGVLRFSNVSP